MRIALVGNPNAGKSTLFNLLTGMHQKIGNYPGVTVDKKRGFFTLPNGQEIELVDLPGSYSIYPHTLDETILIRELLANRDEPFDLILFLADATKLSRNLLFFTQIKDLGFNSILVLNMMDIVKRRQKEIELKKLGQALNSPVVPLTARTGEGLDHLLQQVEDLIARPKEVVQSPFYQFEPEAKEIIAEVQDVFDQENEYAAWLAIAQEKLPSGYPVTKNMQLLQIRDTNQDIINTAKEKEVLFRYKYISSLLGKVVFKNETEEEPSSTERLDSVLTHWFWGYAIFLGILLLIFQSIFSWSSWPMDLIDGTFGNLSQWVKTNLPESVFTNLLAEGIISGIGGIVIFIPQIALLFFFIALLEESGYMARVVFLMDKIMRKFGLSGKSVVPLISGVACAIPAIMATRNIKVWKERLITIFVTPFMTCSARLPVYVILIALVVPTTKAFGFFTWQAVALMFFYFLGTAAALVTAFLMKFFIKTEEKSSLFLEMPSYRLPSWKNVSHLIFNKTKAFVFGAGKIILGISIVLWFLGSYGAGSAMDNAEQVIAERFNERTLSEVEMEQQLASYKLEHSYAGKLGKFIEPIIRPLGYDWKIGIALLTSFAAREVFVGTMATIYSVGEDFEGDESIGIKDRMRREINPETGQPRFTKAVAFSLLIFYALAMQCMSTVAIVKRETKGWKWPIIQTVFMTVLAYISAFAVYQIFS